MNENEKFEPYVSADENPKELTVRAIVIGVILLLVFGTANAYLGLKIGMTVSASIPAAVVSMAIMRGLMKNGSILENNMAQTIASAGESLAAGVVFSLPALYMLGDVPSMLTISLVALFGGIIGVAAMVIYRKYLIVKQHKELAYPEGTACAEILIAGEKGGVSAKTVFQGGIFAAIYRLFQGIFGFFPEALGVAVPGLPGAVLGMNALPSMVGVGYLIGLKTCGVMLAGGFVAAFVITPLITMIGADAAAPIFPAMATIAELGPDGIWSDYVQYIGAGALTVGGIFEFIKAMPVVRDAIKGAFGEFGKKAAAKTEELRTDKDMSFKLLVIMFLAVIIMIAILPIFPIGFLGALMTAIFGFLFVSIASRIVGVVGSSSNPISGMTIATIFASALIFKAMGYSGKEGMAACIIVGALVTVAAAIAGDTSQDLKTGFLVGATPRNQQIGELLGVLIFAGMSGVVLNLLHSAYTIGSEVIPSPATAVISVLVEGIFSGNLPWGLLLTGAALGIMAELLGVSALPFAIGIYLPISLTVPIFIGGVVRSLLIKKGHDNEAGTLYASGLVAGDAIIGVIGAGLAVGGISAAFGAGLFGETIANIICIILFAAVTVSVYTVTKKNKM